MNYKNVLDATDLEFSGILYMSCRRTVFDILWMDDIYVNQITRKPLTKVMSGSDWPHYDDAMLDGIVS